MTIGRNNEAPAAYALTSTIKRLLDHLTEANLFSAQDLESMSQTLVHLSEIVHNSASTKPAPFLETLITQRIDRCRVSLANLQQKINDIAEPLRPTADKLVSILRQMAVINTKSRVGVVRNVFVCGTLHANDYQFSPGEIQKLEAQLREIGDKRKDGQFMDDDGNILKGSQHISKLLDRCIEYTKIVVERCTTYSFLTSVQTYSLTLCLETANFQTNGNLSTKYLSVLETNSISCH